MKRTPLIVALLVLAGAGAAWWLLSRKPPARELVLYGNVDLRQVELAFNNSETDRCRPRAGGRPRQSAARSWRVWMQPSGTASGRGRGNRGRTAAGRRKAAQWQPSARDRRGPGECRILGG